MEILRFGPGYRRPGGPPGTQGLSGQVILHDPRAQISELAFQRFAMIAPHSNPTNTALFIVVSGAGWVQVGDERERVNHGEAVVWPPGVMHGAYTDGTEMRAIIVELMGSTGEPDEAQEPMAALEATGHEQPAADEQATVGVTERPSTTPAQGSLADRPTLRDEYDTSEGEPW